jgi:UDP-glucose 4-epimerase
MNVLITGACGFVGRHLMKELAAAGHTLRLADACLPENATMFAGKDGRTAAPLETDWPFVQVEITDLPAMQAACEGMDAVVHLAAIPTGYAKEGKETMQTNVVGTYVVHDAARLAGAERVFCASSINAFGTFFWRLSGKPSPYTTLPIDETFPAVPEDPYSLSKRCNEETSIAFHRAYGLTTAAFRFAGVWSTKRYEEFRQDVKPTQAWSDLLYQWVHVLDVVRGIRLALECPTLPGSGVYTLAAADTCCPEPTMELLQRFRPGLAASVTTPLPGRTGLLSIARAQAAFGYAPRFRLGD